MYDENSSVTFQSYEEYESGEEGIMTKHEREEKECEFKREIVEERVEEKKDVEVVREDKELQRLGVLTEPDFTPIRRQGNSIPPNGEDGCMINKEMKNV